MTQTNAAWLVKEFTQRKSKNSRYSERAFAKSIGLSPGFLKLVFQGKRSLSASKTKEVANKLGWNEIVSRDLLLSLQRERLRKKGKPAAEKIVADDFFEISDWYHFAIVEMLKTPKATKVDIARRLGISPVEVEYSLAALVRSGLVTVSAGKPESKKNYVVPAVSSSAIRKFHIQMLTKAIDAIEHQPVDSREIRSLTLAFDGRRKAEAAQMIKDFMGRFERRFGNGKMDKVYQLSMAFFSLETTETV